MDQTEEKKTSLIFRGVKKLLRLIYPKMELIGKENLPDGAVIIAGNHCQMHGPIVCELYLPGNRFTWCAGEMMELKKVPAYAYADFWSKKPKWIKPLFKLLSYLIAPIAVFIFGNANTIAVHHDMHIATTFKTTVSKLENNAQIVIFPEHEVKRNNIIYDFQDRFIDVARLYHKRSGKELPFVPMYIAPKLRKIYFGKPIVFSSDAPIDEERRRICEYLMDEITLMARSLPEHTVIPYPNISKKLYPSNKEVQK